MAPRFDFPGNNTTTAELLVGEADGDGPAISSVVIAEQNGDQDGVIGADEKINIEWEVDDPSGVSSSSLTVDGVSVTAMCRENGTPNTLFCTTVVGPLDEGSHLVQVHADDANSAVNSTTYSDSFDVVASEEITVFYLDERIADGQRIPIDFGSIRQGGAPVEKIFVVRNDGDQRLDVGPITGPIGFSVDGPASTVLEPGASTTFAISLLTETVGTFGDDADLLIVNSDGHSSLDGLDESDFIFPIRGIVEPHVEQPEVTVSLPRFARGPAQPVDIPAANGTGIPVTISDGTGVEAIFVELHYDPALLEITEARPGPDAPAGAIVVGNFETPGVAAVSFVTIPPLSEGRAEFLTLIANVPVTATYRSKHDLDIVDVRVNAGDIPAVDDDGVHVVAYLGDTSGDGFYDAFDAVRVLQHEVGKVDHFDPYPNADPAIIGDVIGNGTVDGLDAVRILQESVGMDVPEIPPLPDPLPNIEFGPDPKVSIPMDLTGSPSDVVTVPVQFERLPEEDAVDFQLVSVGLRIRYPSNLLTISDITNQVRPGTITSNWLFVPNVIEDVAPGISEVVISAATATGANPDDGTLALIDFTINQGASGVAELDLRSTGTVLRNDLAEVLVLNPSPQNGSDAVDGLITINGTTASINVEKATNGEDADDPTGPLVLAGSAVTWTYTVTNPGDVALSEIQLTDNQGVTPVIQTKSVNDDNVLDPGEIWTYEATGIAQEGQYANMATVVGTLPTGSSVNDSDSSHYLGVTAVIDVEKATNGDDADVSPGPQILVGSPVTWTYTVTNSGDLPLSDVRVMDDQGVTPVIQTKSLNNDDVLDPSEIWTYAATGTVQVGQYANTATAVATSSLGTDVSDRDDSHYLGVNASIDVEKSTNGEDADAPTGSHLLVGSPVTWTYTVKNTADLPLSNIQLTDDQDVVPIIQTKSLNQDDILDPGEIWTYEAIGTVEEGQYTNTATVVATPSLGPDVTDADQSHYFGNSPPQLGPPTVSITSPDAQAAESGTPATDTGTFRISRTGNLRAPLRVTLVPRGTAAYGRDYTLNIDGQPFNRWYVDMSAGVDHVDVTLTPQDDNLVERTEYLELIIRYNPRVYDRDLENRSASISIFDNEPRVEIAAIDDQAAESGTPAADTGVFRFSRGETTDGDLTVYFTRSGTAWNRFDYKLSVDGQDLTTNYVVIRDGQTHTDVMVEPVDDGRIEGIEYVTLILRLNRSYHVDRLVADRSARVDILDNDANSQQATLAKPVVSISTPDDKADESGDAGTFRITREGSTDGTIRVYFVRTGTARNAADYTLAAGSAFLRPNYIDIPDGQPSIDIAVNPKDDVVRERTENVTLVLRQTAVYQRDESRRSATVDILDNEPIVRIEAIDDQATESPAPATDTATFRITREGDVNEPLGVYFLRFGTAGFGNRRDYTLSVDNGVSTEPLPRAYVEIPAGQQYVDIIAQPLDDSRVESTETIGLRLRGSRRYHLDSDEVLHQAFAELFDDDNAFPF